MVTVGFGRGQLPLNSHGSQEADEPWQVALVRGIDLPGRRLPIRAGTTRGVSSMSASRRWCGVAARGARSALRYHACSVCDEIYEKALDNSEPRQSSTNSFAEELNATSDFSLQLFHYTNNWTKCYLPLVLLHLCR